ncbi:MAG TPA: DUF1549 domain-containing protein [Gemmataceae bacterium]|nr:DUF1549 domain-containing protein [Gemmataceae bacterium]
MAVRLASAASAVSAVRLLLGPVLAVLFAPAVVVAQAPEQVAADKLAATIDRMLSTDWASRGIKPAAPADDAEFVRRVYLDVIGRAPKAAETRDYLDDKSPDKRIKLVEKLLAMPAHANHFAAVTRTAWLPQSATNIQFAQPGSQIEQWLRRHFRENTPADVVTTKLLTAKLGQVAQGGNQRFVQGDPSDPESFQLIGFYQANEARAENVGSAVSRVFLGIKLECAQCHDHPFASYTREQFWEFAAFFAELNRVPGNRPGLVGPVQPQSNVNRITIPNTDREIVAAFFDGTDPKWSNDRTPRQELATWLTNPSNPFFGRNLANRMWAHFFGYGILDPVDEPGENNLPTHPELLDAIGKAFAEGKFDNRLLIRAITRSQAYQLSSRLTHPTQADGRRFARMNLKGLTPAQMFDSLVAATGFRENPNFRANAFAQFQANAANPRGMFLNRFASNEKLTETNTTILQALMLMNGAFVADQTGLEKSEVLAAITDAPFWTTKQRVEAVFVTTFARNPTAEELEKFSSYVDRGGPGGDKKAALADVFWVLLNSTEFLFNH